MPTATTATPCPCCSLPNTLQCRVRGGTAELCGHSEFPNATGGVSVPPKKYRTKTASGTLEDCAYSTSSCTGSQSGAKYVYSGSCTYNISTCAATNTLNYKEYNNAGTCPASTLSSDTAQLCSWGDSTSPSSTSCLMDVTVTKTRVDRTGTGTCCSSGSSSTVRTGSMYWELTDEDTEADAIARLLAGAGGTWGAWTASGATGCTGTPPSCCLAKYESRTSGFTFEYYESEARVVATGLTPSTNYNIKIELYRRAYGSGTYEWYQTASTSAMSDGSGNLTSSGVTVTNTKGYETYAKVSSIYPA